MSGGGIGFPGSGVPVDVGDSRVDRLVPVGESHADQFPVIPAVEHDFL